MPLVPEQKRLEVIETLSDGLQKICKGEITHERLQYRCRIEPLYCYSGNFARGVFPTSWDSESGAEVVPLWESDLSVTARRGKDFIEIDLEDPEDLLLLAYNDQGLLAYLFFFLVEDLGGAVHLESEKNEFSDLLKLSEIVGFRYLNDVIQKQKEIGRDFDCNDKLRRFTQSLV